MAAIRKRTWKTAKGESRQAWIVDFVDASGARQRQQYATKREADAARVEIEAALRGGAFRGDARRVTVAELADSYLEHLEARHRRGEGISRHWLAVTRGHIRNYIGATSGQTKSDKPTRAVGFEEGLGGLKLAQLSTRLVAEFRDRLRDAGVSVSTTRKIVATLRSMLAFAIEADLVAHNAAKGVRVIGRRDEGAKKIKPPSRASVRALIEAADPDFRVILLVAASTGLRAGELRGLRWSDIDFAAGEMSVERRIDAYGDEDAPKSTAGIRTVPIGSAVAAELREWRLRSCFSRESDLVFPNRQGLPLNHDWLRKRRLEPLIAGTGVQIENFHAFRHFAVSSWIDAGLSPKAVQTFAGHANIAITFDRYGHLFPADQHRAAMDQIASQIVD